jgi:hypothetical protein
MKRFAFALTLPLLLTVGIAFAERPAPTSVSAESGISFGDLKVTPEMWFYEQAMRQYKDPKMMVRARAAYSSEQRMHRIESMRWFGFSNGRPQASLDPYHGDYSPRWVSTPSYYPSRWSGMANSSR